MHRLRVYMEISISSHILKKKPKHKHVTVLQQLWEKTDQTSERQLE